MNASNVVVLMPDPDLKALAKIVRDNHEQVFKSASTGLTAAIKAGDALIKAQDKLRNGPDGTVPNKSWTSWLRDHCSISERTARRYMQIANAREEIEHRMDADGGSLTLTVARKLIAKPRAKLSARAKQEVTTPSKTGKPRAFEDPKLLEFIKEHPTMPFPKGSKKFGVTKATYARAHCLQRALGEIPIDEPEQEKPKSESAQEKSKSESEKSSLSLQAARAAYCAAVLKEIPMEGSAISKQGKPGFEKRVLEIKKLLTALDFTLSGDKLLNQILLFGDPSINVKL